MSDTGDSDDSSIEPYLKSRRRVDLVGTSSSNQITNNKNKKRKIVMKIEFDDSDEEESDISYSDGENDDDNNFSDDEVKPSTSNRKRLLQSSDDSDSSNNSEITRKIVRGRKIDKNPILSEDYDDSTTKFPIPNIKNNNNDDDGFNSDSSNNDTLEKCPICLFTFRNQEIGIPNICEHKFCALCIEEWSKNVQTCPIDRQEFITINVYDTYTKLNENIKREIKVLKQINDEQESDPNINDDITYCEICTLSNHEEVMLLCDGCNNGFHMFCLTPPLEQIPYGFWYCDNCFDSDDDTDMADDLNALYEDIRDLGIPETRLRITELRQPRILRTRQSERLRASIVARTRTNGNTNNNYEIDITAPSTSRALNEHSVNGGGRRRIAQTTTATTTLTTTTTRKTTKRKTVSRKRNPIRRRRRKTKKPRSRTYVVEYDVNNFDDKFALKITKKLIRKKRTKRRKINKKKLKLKNSERNINQANGNRKKYNGEQMGIKRLNKYDRPLNSSQSLSLFGNANDLEYFSDSDDNFQQNEFGGGGGGDDVGGSIAIQTSIRFGHFSNMKHRKIIKPNIQPPSSGPIDLLSNLLDMQDRFLNATRQDQINDIRIGSDGSINFGEHININQTTNSENHNNENSSNKNEVNSNDINQAPMFPWNNNNQRNNGGQGGFNRGGGGGGGYNNRFNNQSNYRNNGGSGGSGGNYRNSTGGLGGGNGNNNFRFQMNQNNNNNNNNANFTPNYRGRFNRNNQRNRRNQNENDTNTNDNSNERNQSFNNNSLNQQLYSPTDYNDDNSNQSENLLNTSGTTSSPQEQQRLSSPSRIITSEEVNNSILGLKPSSSSNDDSPNDFNLNRNILNPPPLHVPPLNIPPPVNFTPLHYPTLSQSSLTPSLNHPPPLMGSLISPIVGSMPEPIASISGTSIRSMAGPLIGPMPVPTIGPMPGPIISPMPGTTIGPMMIDFSQPPPPPPPLPETEENDQQSTEIEPTTIIGPQPLAPPPWNENLFKLATDYCDDDDNDDDCPNFSVYSAASFQVANSSAVQNIQSDKAQEDEFDADEDLVQLGDDDDIPNSIDNSENRNRIEFKITGPKLYKTALVDENNKKNPINKSKITTANVITNQDNITNEIAKIVDDDKTDKKTAQKETTNVKENNDDDKEMKLNENQKPKNINEETNNDDDDDDDDESSTNDLTPVTYNDLEKPTNETDTDTTTNTPLTSLKNKKGVLELYDDSDWEELNIEREQLKQKIAMENISIIGPQLEKDNEYMNNDNMDAESLDTINKLEDNNTQIDEIPDRSYTPCLDEKNEDDVVQISVNSPTIIASTSFEKKQLEKSESGIEGIETELISDAEIVVGGEQVKNGKKKDDKKKNDDKNVGKNSNIKKSRRNETFKKVTKNQRERNYRVERADGHRDRSNRHSRSRSHSNDKENKERDKNRRSRERRNSRNRFRRVRRKEIVRYNVRNIINQPRTYKDRYGRDTSRPARSRSRSRPIRVSKSKSRSHIRSPVRSRSRSLSSMRKNVRSFSISPSPVSPQGYGGGRRPFSPRHVRRLTPVGRRRSRSPLRMRSRSISISNRVTGRVRHQSNNRIRQQRSLSNSSKSKSPQAYTPIPKRSGSVIRNRKRKRSKERKKRKIRRRNSSISPPPPQQQQQQQQMILQHSKRLSRPRDRTSPNITAEQAPAGGGGGIGNRKKKSRRSRSKSQPQIDRITEQTRGWTTSPEYNSNEKTNDISWTPPIQSPPQQHSGFRVMFKEPRKKREKKKRNDKRKERNSGSNNRKDKRNKNKDKTPQAPPSKEVFASGDNILVSVSFNKDTTDGNNVQPQQTTVVTLPPTRAEIVSNRRQSSIERQRSRRNKDQSTMNQSSGGGGGITQQRQRKHRKINIKPVAIIDLDRSPFQVIQIPRDIIVLTDSDNENDQRLNPNNVNDDGDGSGDHRSSSVGLLEQQQQLQQQLQQQEQQHRENSINRSVEMNDDDDEDDHNDSSHHHHHHENGHHRLREMDDDDDDDDDDMNNNKTPERNNDRSDSNLPDESYAIQQLGPKTPPEPPIVKFALSTKYRIKPRNPLHEEHERDDQQELEEERERERERLEMEEQQLQQEQQQLQQQQQQLLQQQQQQQQQQHQTEEQEMEEQQQQQQQNINNKIGPNTPPESGPCSPDVYDPFDPTKSPSVSPESQFLEESEMPSHSTLSDKDLTNNESIIERDRKLDKNNINPADLVKALMNTSQDLSKLKKSDQQYINNNNNNNNVQIQSIDNDNLTNEEQQQLQSKSVQVLSNVLLSLGKSHHHIPLISSPPQSSSSLKQQQQSQGFMGITKLPPNMSNKQLTSGSNNYRHNNGSSNDDIINEIDSPYSPCSDDFDDLFEPPPETSNNRNRNKNTSKNTHKYSKTVEIFDNLFGSTSPIGIGSNRLPLPGIASSSARKQRNKTNKKTSVKVAKIPGIGKIDEEQIKIYDDLPNSAVELQVKDKFLRKLNRQERVVEEVKLVLKPHYNRKHITKDEYKEILRRSVPKICHSKSGEINPKKIHNLIEAYVKKFRQRNKLGIGMNTGQVSTAVKCAAYLKKL